MDRRPWSEREIRSALALYYQIPFGAIDQRNPAIIELADVLDRTPGSVGLKLANLASLDPTVVASGRRGMANASKLDRRVFSETSNDWRTLAVELPSSVLDAIDRKREESQTQEMIYDAPSIEEATMRITETIGTVLVRRGQAFFRNATLAAYRGRCCVTALPVRELLRASHIIPWAEDDQARLDPQTGSV
jgi:putative restriction endonuclease